MGHVQWEIGLCGFFWRCVDIAVEVVRQVCTPLDLANFNVISIDFSNKPPQYTDFKNYIIIILSIVFENCDKYSIR